MKLRPGQRIATCRDCGAQGIENPDDIAKGICPDCLEHRLDRLMTRNPSATDTDILRAARAGGSEPEPTDRLMRRLGPERAPMLPL